MRPAPHSTTERVYAALPEVYRFADDQLAAGANGYPLLRFLSLLVDQEGAVRDFADRINFYSPDDGGAVGDTSDLVDPNTADPAWLGWLAQLVGADLPPALSVADQRAAIAGVVAGYLKGTKQGIAAAAATALTGTKYVRVNPLYLGDQFKVELRTRTTETPSTADVVAAVEAKHARPAGIELVCTAYVTTWALLEAHRPTWADWEASGQWQWLEETM